MATCLMVRAEVDPTVRDRFDAWYGAEHLPDASRAFGAVRAWRGWSELHDNVHIAVYEFADRAAADRIMKSDAIRELISEFDRLWKGRVTRTRELVELAQDI